MKNYISSSLKLMSMLVLVTSVVQAMDTNPNQQPADTAQNQSVSNAVYSAIMQGGKTVAGVCAADTLSSLIQSVAPVDPATSALICSAGLAGSLVMVKAAEKKFNGVNLSDVAPSEVTRSFIKKNPRLAITVTILGFIHMYAQQLGLPPTVVYLMLIAAKTGLFQDHKEALGYATASSLYAVVFALAYCGMNTLIN